jgi:hypothetical protein
MQNLEEIDAEKYNVYILDNYLLKFDIDVKFETYSCKCYYGIIFHVNNGRYDVIHNFNMGNRLLINNDDGWKDIPFKKSTFGFLPPGVEAIEI